ncbi:hypothetical protein J7M23_10665 [Candidatus Sumerlaeota bacterium]|nr:hypothetical protein [Candidatus Sumerlaeota bacterium]
MATGKLAHELKVREVTLHKPASILTQENLTHPATKSGINSSAKENILLSFYRSPLSHHHLPQCA